MLKKFAAFTSSVPFITFMAHSGWAALVTVLFMNLYVVAGIVVITAVKEFWFDIKFETGETYKSGAMDFAAYMSGVALALLVRAI